MNVAIVGCGLIGEKRAKNLGHHKLVAVADPALRVGDQDVVRPAAHHWEGRLRLEAQRVVGARESTQCGARAVVDGQDGVVVAALGADRDQARVAGH